MTTFYFIRHAEAEGNLYRRAHGQYNSLITANGTRQIDALRGRFSDVLFDAVYCSDLYRAWATARVLNIKRERPLRRDPGLREIFLGAWEDRPWGEIELRDAQRYECFSKETWAFCAPEGESMEAVSRRMLDAVHRIHAAYPEGRVAVVSHGMAIRALMTLLLDRPLSRMCELPHWDNTAVARFEWDEGENLPRMIYMGDNSHTGEHSTLARQHWWKGDGQRDLHFYFRPAVFPRDASIYNWFRREAWMAVYHSAVGFEPGRYYEDALRCAAAHPRAVAFAMLDGEPVGLIELDTEQYVAEGLGHISLLYLDEPFRGKGLAAQLLGHAVSVFRTLNRTALHLRVAATNAPARHFYDNMGFVPVDTEAGLHGRLLVMHKPISVFPGLDAL